MRVIGTVALVALLAGCGGTTTVVAGGNADEGPTEPAAAIDDRPTGEWRTTSVKEDPPAKAPLVKPDAFGLRFFGDGRVIAQARCNSISGAFRIENGRFRMDDAAMTEMGCPGNTRHNEDQWLSTFLTSGPNYRFTGDRMELSNDTVAVSLLPREQVEPDLELIGTRWKLTHLTDGPAPGAEPDPNSAVSASMAPPETEFVLTGRQVIGRSGCATFTGPADWLEDHVRFGAITVDDTKCSGQPLGVRDVVSILQGDVLVKIHISTLTLTHSSGRGMQLQGEKVPTATAQPVGSAPSGEWRTTAVKAGPGIAPDAFTLTFDDGRVSARARCNTISGAYTIAEGRFVMDQAAQTKMGCPGEGRQEEDQWLVSFLTGKPRFSHDGERITMGTDTDTVVLEPAK